MSENVFPLNFGFHSCSIYRDPSQQFSTVTPFIVDGFASHNQCSCINHEHTDAEFCLQLDNSKIITDNFKSTQQLIFQSPDQTYLKGGVFDTEKTLSFLKESINSSLSQGFTGLRLAAEMSWINQSNTPQSTLFEYESKCNEFYPDNKIIALCQYNENLFSPKFMINVIRTHPYLFLYGKFYENKYFYNSPQYIAKQENPFSDSNYQEMIDIIIND
jgi:hypothetical protein